MSATNFRGSLPDFAARAPQAKCVVCLEKIGERSWVYRHGLGYFAHLSCTPNARVKDLTDG